MKSEKLGDNIKNHRFRESANLTHHCGPLFLYTHLVYASVTQFYNSSSGVTAISQ